jgi:hypothetical protein
MCTHMLQLLDDRHPKLLMECPAMQSPLNPRLPTAISLVPTTRNKRTVLAATAKEQPNRVPPSSRKECAHALPLSQTDVVNLAFVQPGGCSNCRHFNLCAC